MAKRDIERALKRKGIRIDALEWEWSVTPEEMVPNWALEINDEDANRFGISPVQFFDNTAHALSEIAEWEEMPKEPAND